VGVERQQLLGAAGAGDDRLDTGIARRAARRPVLEHSIASSPPRRTPPGSTSAVVRISPRSAIETSTTWS